MDQVNPQSFGVAPQNTQGVNSWVPPKPVSSSPTPNTPPNPSLPREYSGQAYQGEAQVGSKQAPKPPAEALSLGEFEVSQARFSLRFLLISASITVIIASLLTAYLSAAKKASAAQYSKKYDTEISTTIKSTAFQNKQKTVESAGISVANLQSELNSRVKFSNFFTELSNVTYKNSRITRLIVNSQGEATMEGTVSSFNDLAKFVSLLRSSKQFADVRVLTAEKQTNGQVVFSVTFNANNSLLKK